MIIHLHTHVIFMLMGLGCTAITLPCVEFPASNNHILSSITHILSVTHVRCLLPLRPKVWKGTFGESPSRCLMMYDLIVCLLPPLRAWLPEIRLHSLNADWSQRLCCCPDAEARFLESPLMGLMVIPGKHESAL